MSVVDRAALEASPLADLHAVASELSIDGYRRLRRAELIDAILEKQGGGEPASVSASDSADTEEEEEQRAGSRRRRGRRGGRSRPASRSSVEGDRDDDRDDEDDEEPATEASAEKSAEKRAEKSAESPEEADAEEPVEGVVELLAGGSGFVRVDPPDPSDDDVYISSAQVKRCELVSGDRVSGPKRAPRRSERFASLIRIETINGRPASELADSVRFDDLPAAFPSERLKVGSNDPTLKAIEWLTPFGKGSRVSIVGPSRSGKSEALRRLAEAISGREDLSVQVVLAGARPEEISEWSRGSVPLTAFASLGSSEDVLNGTIEPVIDQARRLAARGTDVVVLIDSLDGCSPLLARRALAAARNIVDGGSLTVVATASAPIGGETTVIALDLGLASVGRYPALDLVASGAVRPELLVGEAGAEAIARTRLEAGEPEDE
jgi:transcription termination factor Rho